MGVESMLSKKARFTFATAIIGTMLALTGCNGGNESATSGKSEQKPQASVPGDKKVINIGLKADPPSLDPSQSNALVDRQVQNSIYDKLFDLDKDGNIVPVLVESYEVSPDGKVYTLKLKTGITFHDGTEFNADVVKFNIERYREDNSRRVNEMKFVQKVEVVDPQTVTIELSEPFSPFISILTDRSGMMVSPEAVKKYGDDYLNHPVGTGAYVFVEHVKGDHVTLEKNENYWNGEVKIDELNYKVFTNGTAAVQNLKSGQLDFIDEVPTKEIKGLENNPVGKVVAESGMAYQGFYLNTKQEPFTNKYLRQAVNKAVDREAFIKVVLDGYGAPANSPFAKGNLAHGDSDKVSKPDKQEIKDLLDKGGKPDGFSFKFQIGTSPVHEQFGAVIQSMLKPYGIEVELEKVEFGTMLENGANHKFQALQLGWSGRPDPDQSFFDFVVTDQPNNYAAVSNPELDKLVKQARTELDPAKRKVLYDQAMEIVHDESEYVYIYHDFNRFGVSKKVTGFEYIPDGIIHTQKLDKQ
jgi:peptide/nickel transport system substrate-binding protein